MARECLMCSKKTKYGYTQSHSNVQSRTCWKANLVKIKSFIPEIKGRFYICTRCLRSTRKNNTILSMMINSKIKKQYSK